MGELDTGTHAKIIEAAVTLFASRWYSSVSVAEICRAANVSNGIFYKYFLNKEMIVRTILEDVIAKIDAALGAVRGETLYDRVSSMIEILLEFSSSNPALVTIFREGQYRYFDYERRLKEIYKNALSRVLGRTADLSEFLYAINGIRFAVDRAALQGARVSIAALADITTNGAFRRLSWDSDKIFSISISQPAINIGKTSRERLMYAGKLLFGEKGFHAVNIHEITDAAGLSVGSFYKHFDSKESFFSEQISAAGHEIRRFIAMNLRHGLNRLEVEMQGMYLFGLYLSLDHCCYNITREGEIVSPATVEDYYLAFRRGFHKMGGDGLDADSIANDSDYIDSAIEFFMGISHYYGMVVALDKSPYNARAIVEGVGDCLVKGLSGRG
ncbi:MAG: TetR/AcrR family transcriptional regulator [Spirochaetes bacterium]|nr:TetR/AcrR family transcriptional regulator [Spirochaetota bacterium]